MVLPSENITEVQAFFATRGRSGVQFGEKEFQLGIRWPFPGEKKWSRVNF
jgi:hypothetical protein